MENKSFVSITKVNGYINDTLRGEQEGVGWWGGGGGGSILYFCVTSYIHDQKHDIVCKTPRKKRKK